jgi:hypothetical protein
VGGTPIHFGDDVIGQAIDPPIAATGPWNPSRIADLSLAQAAYPLASEKGIWLPTMQESKAVTVPIATVKSIGEVGPYHADINYSTPSGGIRGPIVISEIQGNCTPVAAN